jgi:cell division ATPase FtsA
MSFRLAHIHDYERFLTVDIWTYKIRVWAFQIQKDGPKCIGYATVRQNKRNIIDGSIADLRAVSQCVERAMLLATESLETVPDDVIVSFSASVCISDILTTQYIRPDQHDPIQMDEIDTMVKKIEHESFSRIRTRAREHYGITHDDIRLVSSTITAINIDKKSVSNPIGFTGKHVKLSVLNLFVPASEFNIIRSLVAHLGKRIISLVPSPLALPKVLEQSEFSHEHVFLLDIGYSHLVFTELRSSVIRLQECFSFWTSSLINEIHRNLSEYSLLQTENILAQEKLPEEVKNHIWDFFGYVFDILESLISSHVGTTPVDCMFLSGGIFQNPTIRDFFVVRYQERFSGKISITSFDTLMHEHISSQREDGISHGLALFADELLVIKKDPLVRLLRYVLYNYE